MSFLRRACWGISVTHHIMLVNLLLEVGILLFEVDIPTFNSVEIRFEFYYLSDEILSSVCGK